MKKRKVLGMLLLLVLVIGLILAGVASEEYVQNTAFSKLEISIEDPSKQGYNRKTARGDVAEFFEQQRTRRPEHRCFFVRNLC